MGAKSEKRPPNSLFQRWGLDWGLDLETRREKWKYVASVPAYLPGTKTFCHVSRFSKEQKTELGSSVMMLRLNDDRVFYQKYLKSQKYRSLSKLKKWWKRKFFKKNFFLFSPWQHDEEKFCSIRLIAHLQPPCLRVPEYKPHGNQRESWWQMSSASLVKIYRQSELPKCWPETDTSIFCKIT